MRLALLVSAWTLACGFTGAPPEQAVYPGLPDASSCDKLLLDEKVSCINSARKSIPFSPATKFEDAGVTLSLSGLRQVGNPRLQNGDRLIKINRESIGSTDDLSRLVAEASDRPLKPVDVLLARNGDLVFLTISLDEMIEIARTASRTGLSNRISVPDDGQSVSSALVSNEN